MATESIKYVAPEVETKTKSKTFPRPGQHTSGVVNWLTTIDHKKIGVMYGLSALFFLIVGGIEALLIRSQLWSHNMEVLTNREYNQMFTMQPLVFHRWWNYPEFELVFYRRGTRGRLVWLRPSHRHTICRSHGRYGP